MATTSTSYTYKQGHYVGKTREYFYYIDHNGQLFMDDARMKNFTSCFKDKKFLDFFFARVRHNETGRYEDEFPYVSPCGREMNYVRCDDRPIVFTQLEKDQELWHICNSNRTYPFTPTKLCMLPNGRLYHSAPVDNYGLVKSALADELFPRFVFDDDGKPTHFRWRDELVELENELLQFVGSPSRQ
ncbi:hypothetical protein AAVH_05809 [Aphelenchoides avenae]|nr:hypothetical protein AAVH_32848 [Aphelenchus avenae]KAH7726922.1 hypothetical protein AAVH_05809 [Aphelenchus avenae]